MAPITTDARPAAVPTPAASRQLAALVLQVQAQGLSPQAVQLAATTLEASDHDGLETFALANTDAATLGALAGALLLRQNPPRTDLLDLVESRLVPQIIAETRDAQRLGLRRRSLQALGWIPSAAVRGHLLEVLRSRPDRWEGRLAAQGLERIGDETTLVEIAEMAAGSEGLLRLRLRPLLALLYARLHATATVLRASPTDARVQRCVPLLAALAQDGQPAMVQTAAVSALSERLARADADGEIHSVVQGLATAGTPQALAALQEAFLRGTAPDRLRLLASTLADSAPEFLWQQTPRNTRPRQALAAGSILLDAGHDVDVGLLPLAEELVWKTDDPALRRMALGVLGRMQRPAVPVLLNLARSARTPTERALALGWLLRAAATTDVSADLAEIALRDPDVLVRERAQRALTATAAPRGR